LGLIEKLHLEGCILTTTNLTCQVSCYIEAILRVHLKPFLRHMEEKVCNFFHLKRRKVQEKLWTRTMSRNMSLREYKKISEIYNCRVITNLKEIKHDPGKLKLNITCREFFFHQGPLLSRVFLVSGMW